LVSILVANDLPHDDAEGMKTNFYDMALGVTHMQKIAENRKQKTENGTRPFEPVGIWAPRKVSYPVPCFNHETGNKDILRKN
jgi:hypothetical protein